MIQRLGRRALEAFVALFALLGFAFVPLGQRTALEHMKGILSTEAAAEAGRELVHAGLKLRQRLLEVATRSGRTAEPGDDRPEESPTPGEGPLALPSYADAGAGADSSQPYSPGS